jgi:hypothetical protein
LVGIVCIYILDLPGRAGLILTGSGSGNGAGG